MVTAQSSTGSEAPSSTMASSTTPMQDSPAATAQPSSVSPISPGLSSGHSPQPSAQPSTHPSTHPSTQTNMQTSQTPTPLLGSHSHPEDTSSRATNTPSPTLHPRTTAAAHPSATTLLSSMTTPRLTAVSEATTQLHTSGGVSKPITCHNIKDVSDSGALCLRLNESHTCVSGSPTFAVGRHTGGGGQQRGGPAALAVWRRWGHCTGGRFGVECFALSSLRESIRAVPNKWGGWLQQPLEDPKGIPMESSLLVA
ncbi:hypothetical protein CIB84_014662 [Bambusicola thoracicus]|uniref:Uncharacterized protein n=1 Tax=Bambusicola thoracicus TaxID=9083 RepID=A0A2P4SBV9_BAMTH|nr:hypothetical protein CIB84_014662 [Bambusicola thoracicus]